MYSFFTQVKVVLLGPPTKTADTLGFSKRTTNKFETFLNIIVFYHASATRLQLERFIISM